MNITVTQLKRISKGNAKLSLVNSLADAINTHGPVFGLNFPHRLAQFLAQVGQESGHFRHDREIWGPTKAQRRYEGREDLGNVYPGDGSKFRGYGPIQLTGRNNVTNFYHWCVAQGFKPPNFIENPELIATGIWAGLSAFWYWSAGNPTHKSLNVLADANNIEMITKRVNGGLTHYAERLEYYDRAALVLLGYGPTEITRFQKASKNYTGQHDGESGPKTRAALHLDLVALSKGSEAATCATASPVVVVEEKRVAVTPKSLEKEWWKSKEVIAPILTGGGLSGAATFLQSFGSIPTANLIVLIVAVFAALAGFLIWSKMKDRKEVRDAVHS